MIKALLKKDKEDKTEERKKEKKKEEREGKQSTKPISTKEPTKKSVPKIQLSANARNAQPVDGETCSTAKKSGVPSISCFTT